MTHRVIVEFADDIYESLDALTSADGPNKTTVVNRAVQLYDMLHRTQERGGRIFVQESPGDEPAELRILSEA